MRTAGLILLILWLPLHAAAQDESPSLKELLPPVKPLSPPEALKAFQIDKGFSIELVAAEPDVVDPIAAAFDANGWLYVCEDIDYPYGMKQNGRPLGRVRLLEDRDSDGRFETSHIFAKGVHWPSGIVPWKGGVFVAAPPQILYMKDTDGDRKADLRRVIFDGWGTRTAEDIMNNLKWGIDNRIYGATSYNGGEVKHAGIQKGATVSLRGRDFRFDPLTMTFEPVTGGGGDFGNCFDDWGNRFVSNAGTLLIQIIEESPSLSRNRYFSPPRARHQVSAKWTMNSISRPEPWRVVRRRFWDRWVNTTNDMRAGRFSKQELAEKGFVTGAGGIAIYGGHTFPDTYHGDSFTAEPAGNVVIRLKLGADGLAFTAKETSKGREFLASTDNWFRPVNVINGPDGSLYVLDMYRELIEDPSAIPKDILAHIDVTNGRDRGRIYRIAPDDIQYRRPPDFMSMVTSQLVTQLDHRNRWTRQTAQRLLIERSDREAIGELEELFLKTIRPQTKIHVLRTMDGLGANHSALIVAALNDEHPWVREHASDLAGRLINGRTGRILKLVKLMSQDGSQRVRFQTALTLALSENDDVVAALATIVKRDVGNPWIRAAVLAAVEKRSAALLGLLIADKSFVERSEGSLFLGNLAAITGARNNPEEVSSALKAILQNEHKGRERLRQSVIRSLAGGLSRSRSSLAAVLRGNDIEVMKAAMQKMFDDAEATAVDQKIPVADRESAVELLAYSDHTRVLIKLIDSSQPHRIQRAAVKSLSSHASGEVGELLMGCWPGTGPDVRRLIVDAMLSRSPRVKVLLASIESGVVRTGELDAAQRQTILQTADDLIRQRARKAFGDRVDKDRQNVVDRFREKLVKGDVKHGEPVFVKTCGTCHSIKPGVTNPLGPDLRKLNDRSSATLLINILDPNRSVSANYVSYKITTTDGRNVTGIIVNETDTAITIRRADAEETVLRTNVDSLRSTGMSLMPVGLEQGLSERQMSDLIAYVQSLR